MSPRLTASPSDRHSLDLIENIPLCGITGDQGRLPAAFFGETGLGGIGHPEPQRAQTLAARGDLGRGHRGGFGTVDAGHELHS